MSHLPDLIVASHIEPVALVAENGVVLALNGGFATLLGVPVDAGGTVTLGEIADLDADASARLIGDCIANPGPRPMRLLLLPLGTIPRMVEGFAWRCKSGPDTAVLLRIGRRAHARAGVAAEALDRTTGVENRSKSDGRRRSDGALGVAMAKVHEAEEIKDQLMAQISHDLRTPLNGILGLSEFILDEPFGRLNRRYRGYVDDIRHCGRELLELIDKVLLLTAPGHPNPSGDPPQAELSDCLRACLRVVTPIARQKGVQIVVADGLTLPRIRAEGATVKQVLYNLLGNAIKFTPTGGTISIDGDRDGRGFALHVTDNGRGITVDDLSRVFEPFYRAGDSYTAAEDGSGLGLALARRSVEQIGGRLDIESAPNVGTCATVTLPTAGEAARNAA